TKIMSLIMYNIAYRPVNIILNTLNTHTATKKGYSWKMLLGIVVSGVAGFVASSSSPYAKYYSDNYYHRMGNDTTLIRPAYYADQLNDGLLYHPFIPSYQITKEGLFTVFIPFPNREYFELERQCSEMEVDSNLSGDSLRRAKRVRLIRCTQEYLQLAVNNQDIKDYLLHRHYYGPEDQFGILATMDTKSFQLGRNRLTITAQYLDEDDQPRLTHIPFYYLPNEKEKIPTTE
ncbi:MAG: hypothetical protein AAFU03_08045, partial [Bacteroidota bacterium]